ncbi:MAG: hypothetical protein KatS3mg008_0265 [Acidimicrobiales bacterium]|nr:MAG: hypothetical protein KatS3mg008_0265 [Acidimicrobiales bacterium]
MPTIRATCDTCGDVVLGVDDLAVQIEEDEGYGLYLFCCPRCHTTVAKPASEQTIDLLVTAGVRCFRRRPPLEVLERTRGLGPITVDEIIEFHHALADEEEFAIAIRRLTG